MSALCPPNCECGLIFSCLRARDELHAVSSSWVLNAKLNRKDPCVIARTSRPCLVLALIEHVPSIEDLDEISSRELGPLVPLIASELRARSGALRISMLYLNVALPRHVHIHFVPHFTGDDSRGALELLEQPLPDGAICPAGVEIARGIAEVAATMDRARLGG
jgi:hypothetical protein